MDDRPERQKDDWVEVEVSWLSGKRNLLEVHRNTSPRQLRKTLRELMSCPFLTLYGPEGDQLDFDWPIARQVVALQCRISVQAIAQQPRLTCNSHTAVLWCPCNPFLCALGSEYSGNCIDKTRTPYATPIRKVFAGTGSWPSEPMNQ